MNIYTNLVSRLIFPLQEAVKGRHTRKKLKELEITQWYTYDKLEHLQLSKLREFLLNIQENVPYYSELFKALDFLPSSVTAIHDLSKLPLLDKDTISKNLESLKSINNPKLSRFNTGGSSGSPLIFYLNNERVKHDVAAKWRATRWWNVDIGDPEIVAWGSPIELGAQDKLRKLRDDIFRSELIPAFDMSDQKLLTFIERIKEKKPKILFGYPSVFDLLARTAEKYHIILDDLCIKVAFVTSERLYPYQRDAISRVFGCPVANGYGSRDAGFIAHECPQGGMHLSYEDIIVEIVDPEGNVLPEGQAGEIVVTHLSTKGFPFVRYRTGDIATLSKRQCSCGRGLPILKSIEGRSTDFIMASDGTLMHGLALIYILRDIEGIEEFKVTQESLLLTVVQIVPNKLLPESTLQNIQALFKERLGQDVVIDLKQVNKITPEKSGKYRYVTSKLS